MPTARTVASARSRLLQKTSGREVLIIMAAGTLWITTDLAQRMFPGTA